MLASSAWLALNLLLGLMALTNSMPAATNTSEKLQSARAAPKSTLRQRGSHGPWRLVVVLAQNQPVRSDVQRAWENAVQELAHTDVELVYVEARALPAEGSGHPTALLNNYCSDVKAGKTAMTIVLGGGSAARFLVTASSSMKLPVLWIPHSHRDFIKQGRPAEYESRFGITSEEMGAAAAALMHKAHWHVFTLLIDANLLPVNDLLRKEHPYRSAWGSYLAPRSVIYLPADERTLGVLLRRVSEENGRGSVLVLACDLSNAKKVIAHAGKLEMLAGRFLWLWLDLKGELRLNEPNIIGTHVLQNARVSVTSDHIPSSGPESPGSREPRPNLLSEHDVNEQTLSNLASEIHKMQEFHWLNDYDRLRHKRDSQPIHQQSSYTFTGSAPSSGSSSSSSSSAEEDSEEHPSVNSKSFMPLGMLALRPANTRLSGSGPEAVLGRALRETTFALDRAMLDARPRLGRLSENQIKELFLPECFAKPGPTHEAKHALNANLTRRLRETVRVASKDRSEFHLLNLQGVLFPGNKTQLRWTRVGLIKSGRDVRLDTIIWPGGGIVPAYVEQGREKIGMPLYKIVTALAPPFVMITDLQEGSCLRGLVCKHAGVLRCCYGYSMDLLYHVSQDLEFRFDLHVVKDGVFGRRRGRNGTWNGVVGELLTGKAQMAFAPLSVYSHRSQVVDFSSPYYFSSVSFLIAPKERNEISLLAFLQPFSTELWIAVVTSLNITAMFVACYEWFSPFGLNPWGRQRSKNFSIASALWVTWGLLCGHLVAFKAPKSWPNKFLINVWGGFSVIFVASYTANIAALIAGLFFHSTVNDYHERSLLQQRVGAPKASAAEYYVQQANPRLWSYMSRYSVADVADGVQRLLNGSLDILIADTPIIDYHQLTDNGCRLEKIGDFIKEDTYGVGLSKHHPMTESISKLIANYTSTGLLDILQEKWYGGLPCMRGAAATTAVGYDGQPRQEGQPRPLGVASVAGVFCLLGLGMIVGIIILIGEHIFYKYSLPKLRQCPKNSIWRSRNVMFFSQKLYRFINCVELVSPHHAARELVHTVRQGQITSLFQKSVKRSDLFQKEHERNRRRKSKAQFFEMIQEIRRAQQEEQRLERALNEARGAIPKNPNLLTYERARSRSKSPNAIRGSAATSPRQRSEKSRSSTNLGFTPLGLEPSSPPGPREFTLSSSNLRARSPLELVGRRLSHGNGEESPPPTPKLESFGNSPNLKTPRRGESMASSTVPTPKQRSPTKRGQSFPAFSTLRTPSTSGQQQVHYQVNRSPLLSPNSELTFAIGRKLSREWGSGIDLSRSSEAVEISSISQAVSHKEAPPEEGRSRRRKKSHGDASQMSRPEPARRSRSHDNKDKSQTHQVSSGQSVLGGQSTSAQAKRKLESELKAILTARAHHFELHPP